MSPVTNATRARGVVVAACLTLIMLASMGAASAYWGGPGGGSGSAVTGTTRNITLSPGTVSTELYPGSSAAVSLRVNNPNAGPVHVGRLGLDTTQGISGFTLDSGHSGCLLSALSFSTQTNGGPGWDFEPGATNLTLSNSVSMSVDSTNACQGATFTISLNAAP